MTPTWVILAVPAVILTGCAAIRRLRRRRADLKWAAAVASSVHDRRYLDWLESEFAAMDAGERP